MVPHIVCFPEGRRGTRVVDVLSAPGGGMERTANGTPSSAQGRRSFVLSFAPAFALAGLGAAGALMQRRLDLLTVGLGAWLAIGILLIVAFTGDLLVGLPFSSSARAYRSACGAGIGGNTTAPHVLAGIRVASPGSNGAGVRAGPRFRAAAPLSHSCHSRFLAQPAPSVI